jgi:hypothetical protein
MPTGGCHGNTVNTVFRALVRMDSPESDRFFDNPDIGRIETIGKTAAGWSTGSGQKYASVQGPVLFTGPPGMGKEVRCLL